MSQKMRTQRAVVGSVILLLAAGATGMFVFGQQPLQERALAAYKAGRFAEALPLFKQIARQRGVFNNPDQLRLTMAYINDIQIKMKVQEAATQSAAGGATATGPQDQQALIQQALQFAMQTKVNPNDPPMTKDTRVPHKAVPAGTVAEVSIKEMGNFEFDPTKDADVPADVKLLEGAKVKLNGYMWPMNQSDKITEFALVPSLTSCCFGAPPGVQHVVTCRAPGGKSVDFSVDEIYVEGIVHVRVKRENDYTSSIFEVDVTSVRPKEQ